MTGRAVLTGVSALAALGMTILSSRGRDGATSPPSTEQVMEEPSCIDAAIARQPICIGSTVSSAGELGDTLYYQSSWDEDGRLLVGYYAFFSAERPWGDNWLTWALLPALALDAVYTHFLFFAPGLQRWMYGKGDVEGFRIAYEIEADGRLSPSHGLADGGDHREVLLRRADLLSLAPEQPTVYSRWWSHQLGGRGARPGELVARRCYETSSIQRLPKAIAIDFRLDRRAAPAHVDSSAARKAPPALERLSPPGAVGVGSRYDQSRVLRPSVAL